MFKWKLFQSINSEIDPTDAHRDWRLIESVLNNVVGEQKRARRWGIFFKLLTFIYLFVVLILFLLSGSAGLGGKSSKSHTAIVKLNGVISASEPANANAIVTGLRAAFKNEHAKGVILAINSPGGSPVQSGYIYDEIVRLRLKYPKTKLYVVISDLGASGGYYIASAADEIYADKASLVGSIGVTASGFGFVESLNKLGVERRHFTSGKHKGFLDPFSPLKPDEKEFWQGVLDSTHQQFIDAVKKGRGDRLKIGEGTFSGLIWNGEQALALGLVDGLGSVSYVAREVIGEEDIVDYSYKRSPIEALVKGLGVSIGTGVAKSLGLSSEVMPLH